MAHIDYIPDERQLQWDRGEVLSTAQSEVDANTNIKTRVSSHPLKSALAPRQPPGASRVRTVSPETLRALKTVEFFQHQVSTSLIPYVNNLEIDVLASETPANAQRSELYKKEIGDQVGTKDSARKAVEFGTGTCNDVGRTLFEVLAHHNAESGSYSRHMRRRGVAVPTSQAPLVPITACSYFGERDRRFRERDRFGGFGRCAVSIVDFLAIAVIDQVTVLKRANL
jgi:hypothetical protein